MNIVAFPENSNATKELTRLAQRIHERSMRMLETNADFVRLALASGDDLIAGREYLGHGRWLPWLRNTCHLRQRQALNYVTLAQHRTIVETYLQRAANMGTQPSIRGALRIICPPDNNPKRPKKISDLESPEILGTFLEDHHDLFFAALPHAPTLTAEVNRRLTRPLGHKQKKARAKAAREDALRPPLMARGAVH